MYYLIISLLFLFTLNSSALAEENLFNSYAAIKEETIRVKDEAGDFLTTPVDTDHYGLVGTLAVVGATGLTYVFDKNIRDEVQSTKSKTLDKITDVGSFIGEPLLHIGIAGTVYVGALLAESPKYQETGLMLGEALFLADASTLILKESIGRERPFIGGDKGRFNPFQFKADSDSLPSMHAASSFAMASVLATTSEKFYVKLLYYSAATFVGFSRIYQDKHWASDIVLAAAIGELSGRVVTNYHATHARVAIAPMLSGNSTGLALVGHW
ncbi:phosphatase PAP2 family protein [Geobacter argillaceus]|uniref:PAP2 superfamily protein n=1 Tax=Geobacter argillaceus TaxID=345631 RepID=A0A562V698_9BACT|nr:phosphatase PAP2 family protein [Geobacter argillaceus]TWJ13322.1 PAP2 superfamily protein [Geobacter argillaceus]